MLAEAALVRPYEMLLCVELGFFDGDGRLPLHQISLGCMDVVPEPDAQVKTHSYLW